VVPLKFPPHFPPSNGWKKFFIGVRWLGPDLSFFKDLKATQAARTADCMEAWQGSQAKTVASLISRVLSKQLGWKAPYFIPEDSAEVAFHGPSFDFTDPGAAFDAVVEALDLELGMRPSKEFWQAQSGVSMSQLVAGLLAVSGRAVRRHILWADG
jgi:hypothetical protein